MMKIPRIGDKFIVDNVEYLRINPITGIYVCLEKCIFAVDLGTYTVKIFNPTILDEVKL